MRKGELYLIIFGVLFAVAMMGIALYAAYDCGFTNTFFYGKNVFWAWFFDRC